MKTRNRSDRTGSRASRAAVASLLALSALGASTGSSLAAPGGGSIWTTNVPCTAVAAQNANEYAIGDTVYVRGANFAASAAFDWTVTGMPGGASGDPNTVVSSGSSTTAADGAFCLAAYVVAGDDWGVYSVDVDQGKTSKNDNYHVEAGSAPADEPGDEPPADEPPADETPADETPADETPADETPADETPADETPADETPADETPADETPADETPADETPADETPADETPADETPADEPGDLQPANEPGDETPADETPADETPADETPAEETPAYESTTESPADETPADETPASNPADEPGECSCYGKPANGWTRTPPTGPTQVVLGATIDNSDETVTTTPPTQTVLGGTSTGGSIELPATDTATDVLTSGSSLLLIFGLAGLAGAAVFFAPSRRREPEATE